ncbi:translation initiation factor eIF-1A [archaeon]|nr:translation initiation factor eIF-1A [archaeon]
MYKKTTTEEPIRVKVPRGRQVLGIIDQRLGGSRMRVRCLDGKTRICRIPGRLKRKLWIREGDTLLIEPWEFEQDTRGDVIFKYRPNQIDWLKRKGLLKEMIVEDL